MAGSSGLYQSLLSHARPVSKACDFDSLFTWLWFWLWWLAPCFTQPHAATVTTWWKSLTSPPRAWNNNDKQLIKARWEKVGEKTFVHLLSSWMEQSCTLRNFWMCNKFVIKVKHKQGSPRKTKSRNQALDSAPRPNQRRADQRGRGHSNQWMSTLNIFTLSANTHLWPCAGASLQPRHWLMSFPVRLLIGSLQNCCRIL